MQETLGGRKKQYALDVLIDRSLEFNNNYCLIPAQSLSLRPSLSFLHFLFALPSRIPFAYKLQFSLQYSVPYTQAPARSILYLAQEVAIRGILLVVR